MIRQEYESKLADLQSQIDELKQTEIEEEYFIGDSIKEEPKRWKDVFHYGFGYTACPYCGDETGWYNPASQRFQTDLENNQREHCPKCGKRVYAREGWLINQPS